MRSGIDITGHETLHRGQVVGLHRITLIALKQVQHMVWQDRFEIDARLLDRVGKFGRVRGRQGDYRGARVAAPVPRRLYADRGMRIEQVFAGLEHLEGETVQILADGAVKPNEVVTSGQITLESEASIVHVGLSFTSKVKTMPLEGGGESGTSQGKPQRVHKVHIRILDSLAMKHGIDDTDLSIDHFRESSGLMDQSPDLFTGIRTILLDGDYDNEYRKVFEKCLDLRSQVRKMHGITLSPRQLDSLLLGPVLTEIDG